jgi:hypothetical protein
MPIGHNSICHRLVERLQEARNHPFVAGGSNIPLCVLHKLSEAKDGDIRHTKIHLQTETVSAYRVFTETFSV